MPRIVTVLRRGGGYSWQHVERLRRQCLRFARGAEFMCLSDDPRGTPLQHDWPGWWAKMEMFRLPGPCLYMDLDTTITGDLQPLLDVAKKAGFVTLRDFNAPQREVQSSLMAWACDMRWLYERFAEDPARHMAENDEPRWWGDQGFIERNTRPEFWQNVLPGACVSWKKHCANGLPFGARVVVFHGRPRPWEVGM